MTLEKTTTNRSTRSNQSCDHRDAAAVNNKPEDEDNGGSGGDNNKNNTGETYASPSDPLVGHLHHLTREQTEALRSFKAACVEKELYNLAEEGREASHDDATLLRFLRARRFDVKAALDQFQTTEEWRKANDIKALYENFDVDSYEESRRVYPQWTGRRDRRGIPVYVFEIKDLNSKNMAAYSSRTFAKATSSTHSSSTVPPRLLRLFALYENMVRFVLPLCSSLSRPNPDTPIVTTTNIVDISGVGLKQFWNLKGHMQDASTLATAHYPETLDRIFIIGAPSFFPTVWGWIKRWFDPVTTSKIFILSASEVKPTLTSFMDPSSFPKRYGGELDWEWGDMPKMDEPTRAVASALERIGDKGDKDEKDNVDERDFIKGPVVWEDTHADIYGSIEGEPRRRTIAVEQHPVVEDSVPPAESKSDDTTPTMTDVDEKVKVVQPADEHTAANGTVSSPQQTVAS